MVDSSADEDSNLLAKLRSSRAGKLSHIKGRINIVNSLMSDSEDLEEVKENMDKFNAMLDEFKSLDVSYEQTLNEQNRNDDFNYWYEPRLEQIDAFIANVSKWIASIENLDAEAGNDVPVSASGSKTRACPDDENKVSVVASVCSNVSVSSTASVRICVEAEREALLAKAAALKQKHAIEKEEEQPEH